MKRLIITIFLLSFAVSGFSQGLGVYNAASEQFVFEVNHSATSYDQVSGGWQHEDRGQGSGTETSRSEQSQNPSFKSRSFSVNDPNFNSSFQANSSEFKSANSSSNWYDQGYQLESTSQLDSETFDLDRALSNMPKARQGVDTGTNYEGPGFVASDNDPSLWGNFIAEENPQIVTNDNTNSNWNNAIASENPEIVSDERDYSGWRSRVSDIAGQVNAPERNFSGWGDVIAKENDELIAEEINFATLENSYPRQSQGANANDNDFLSWEEPIAEENPRILAPERDFANMQRPQSGQSQAWQPQVGQPQLVQPQARQPYYSNDIEADSFNLGHPLAEEYSPEIAAKERDFSGWGDTIAQENDEIIAQQQGSQSGYQSGQSRASSNQWASPYSQESREIVADERNFADWGNMISRENPEIISSERELVNMQRAQSKQHQYYNNDIEADSFNLGHPVAEDVTPEIVSKERDFSGWSNTNNYSSNHPSSKVRGVPNPKRKYKAQKVQFQEDRYRDLSGWRKTAPDANEAVVAESERGSGWRHVE